MNSICRKTIAPMTIACFALLALASNVLICAANGQTFTNLKSFGIFTNVTGFEPLSQLVQGPDGTLYGTLRSGEGNVAGTVFSVQPDGSGFTVLKWFTNSFTNSIEGANPLAGLTLSGSVLYGTTAYGGSSNHGTVFKVNTDGTAYTVLKNFTGSDGATPSAVLTLSGSVLYGTTSRGGSSDMGTVFKLLTDGIGYTVLKNFTGYPSDGASPVAGLALSGSVLYGTTGSGGISDEGTVFKLNTDGSAYTILKHFNGSGGDGQSPRGLTLSGSVLYGTTAYGGGSNLGTVFKVNTDGTGYTVLKNFTGSDGAYPFAGLTLSGSVLYGTTFHGGSSNLGTVFKVNTDGTGYTILKHFTSSDEPNPLAGLTLSGSVLYGTTSGGVGSEGGTVFKLNLSIPLTFESLGNAVVLRWPGPAFALQAAPALKGVYTNIPAAGSPHTNFLTDPQQFFRLKLE